MGRWYPTGKPPSAHYYLCKQCGARCFITDALNCPSCGAPFVKYDKHMKVLPGQLSFEECAKAQLMKKKVPA